VFQVFSFDEDKSATAGFTPNVIVDGAIKCDGVDELYICRFCAPAQTNDEFLEADRVAPGVQKARCNLVNAFSDLCFRLSLAEVHSQLVRRFKCGCNESREIGCGHKLMSLLIFLLALAKRESGAKVNNSRALGRETQRKLPGVCLLNTAFCDDLIPPFKMSRRAPRNC
jgi:hypothetical protein